MKTQQQMTIAARVWILEQHLDFLGRIDREIANDNSGDAEKAQLHKCIRKVIAEEQEKARGQIAYYNNL